MSYHDRQAARGGESVGWLAALDPVERLVVESVRLWPDGPEAQAEVWNRFATGLGPDRGRRALAAFEAWLACVAGVRARRLCRHAPACPCVGRDEADLAALVACAGRGDAGAAEVAARLVVPGQVAAATAAAARLGCLLDGYRPVAGEGSAARARCFRTLH